MNKIVNGVANDYEFEIPNIIISNEKNQIKQQFELQKEIITNKILTEKDKEIDRLNNIINELEKYIIDEINEAQEELNVILQGNDLEYKNECTKEFNCIKNALDMLLDKLKELKENNNV